MTALQALQGNLNGCVVLVCLYLLVVECCCDVDTASAADYELAPNLCVKVQEDIAVQLALRKTVGTKHACLFVSGDKCFYRTVLQILSFHDCHDGSHAETVVASEGSMISTNPVAIDDGFDRVVFKVVIALRCFLRNHVHVSLEDNALAVLHTRSGRLAHYDVARSILECLYTCFLCPVEQISLNFLQMS